VSVRGVGEAMIARARRGGTFTKTIDDEYREATNGPVNNQAATSGH
jgi:hypothetical protein